MRSATRVERIALVLVVFAFFALLIVLIGSLDELPFRPGRPLPQAASDEASEVTDASVPEPLSRGERIVALILGGLTLLSVGGVVLFRRLRKQFLQYMFFFIASVLPLLLGAMILSRLFAPRSSTSLDPYSDGPIIPDSLLSNPPMWMLVAASGLLSLFILGAFAFLVLRLKAIRRHVIDSSQATQLGEQLDALANQAGRTADRIRAGNPLRGEVIRCYQEMVRLLQRAGRFTPTYLTPREFARSLRHHGIDSEHVYQLTELFELVRYGARADSELAERALTCLDQIERHYGKRETKAT